MVDLTEALASIDGRELGERLRAARIRSGINQAEACQGIISTAYISRIESGKRRPNLKILRLLAQRLGITEHEILFGGSVEDWSRMRAQMEWARLELRSGNTAAASAAADRLMTQLPDYAPLWREAALIHAQTLEADGAFTEAARELESLYEKHAPDVQSLEIITTLSRCYREAGALYRAIDVGHRATERIHRLELQGTPEAIKLSLTLAAAYAEMGDVAYAKQLCEQALRDARRSGDGSGLAGAYWNASIIESRMGQHDYAVDLAHRAIKHLDDLDSPRNIAGLRSQLGLLMLRSDDGDPAQALEVLQLAHAELDASAASPVRLADNRLGQAQALYRLGEAERAHRLAQECVSVGNELSPILAAEAERFLARISWEAGDPDTTRAWLDSASTRLEAIGARQGAAQIWHDLGQEWARLGAAEEAADAFRFACELTGLRSS